MPARLITTFADLIPGRLYRATLKDGSVVLRSAETRGRPMKLSPAEACMVHALNAQGYSQRRLAREMGCSVRQVRTALGAP